MLKCLIPAVAVSIGLAACDSAGGEAPVLADSPGAGGTIALSFRWCAATPEFKVSKVPPGTKTLRFRLVDHQAPGYRHGGGEVAFSGRGSMTVPCGGLTSSTYDPPHPPAGTVHEYEWTVTALDAGGATLATGTAVKNFPERPRMR